MASNSSGAIVVPSPPPLPGNVPAQSALEGQDIRDIKPPVEIPSVWDWLGWVLACLVAIAAAYALARWWRRRRATRRAQVIVVPPHVKARNRLRSALDLLSQPERFCVLISDTLRIYLEERFELHAPERTTEEFLKELQETTLLHPDQKLVLGDFLARCDLVKFARQDLTETELRELLETALRLIDETAAVGEQASARSETTTKGEAP